MIRREIIGELREQKVAIVGGLWANNSFEKSEEADRSEAISEIEENFRRTVAMIHGDLDSKTEEEMAGEGEYTAYSEDNPFFQAGKRAMGQLDIPRSEAEDNLNAEDVVDMQKELDQLE